MASHRADSGKCPLLQDEPPFLAGPDSPLETLSSLFQIYFSDRLPGQQATSKIGASNVPPPFQSIGCFPSNIVFYIGVT